MIALVVWVARHTYWDEVTVTAPPKGEAARNPYYAVVHLAESLGIHTTMIGSLHELPPDAIVLVNNLYEDLRHESIESLQAWVQAGGRSDHPRHHPGGERAAANLERHQIGAARLKRRAPGGCPGG